MSKPSPENAPAEPGGDASGRPETPVSDAAPPNPAPSGAAHAHAAASAPEHPEHPDHPGTLQEHLRAARDEFESQVALAREQFEQTNERIKERTGRDLILAILIGLAIGGALLGSLIFFKWIFVLFALAAALMATFELCRALQGAGRRLDVVPQLLSAAAIIASPWFLDPSLVWVILFVGIIFVVVWRMVAQMAAQDGRRYGDVLRDVLTGAFVQLYVPFLAGLAVMLVRQPGGEWWVLAFVIVAVSADTGAYAAGISFGKHPMAPRISPKKTWEGFAGAVVLAITAGVLLGIFMLHQPWWVGLILGIVILVSATIGDLGESLLKRDLGIKDMSSWIPGHGGLLDRLDSILPSAAAALALYALFAPVAAL
ncbi:MAG: phosphatidate cytidylyltransferase [Microbacteriaceae bacterium]|jgi:phosphatidate cytidylyltransferase|nr:phosphatidate cytidylyltransferase [Microbacteriaceae bacterium]HPZ35455.1 phosphatidate cytidylyltransferase [Microbacteriaceae bacterium]